LGAARAFSSPPTGCCTNQMPAANTRRWRLPKHSSTPGSPARSEPSATRWTARNRPVQDRGYRPRAEDLDQLATGRGGNRVMGPLVTKLTEVVDSPVFRI